EYRQLSTICAARGAGDAVAKTLRSRRSGRARGRSKGLSIRGDEFASRPTPDEAPVRDEVERLMLLVEASSTLLGSPRLEAVLPAVPELPGPILAAHAYALWP